MRPGLIFAVFLLSVLAPVAVLWWRLRRWGLPVRVRVDPDEPCADDIARYLAEIAQRLDERPSRMRLVFDGRNTAQRRIELDFPADRTMRVTVEGRRAKTFSLRSRWIADHPVPLDLCRAVLYVEPVEANRFRVMTQIPFAVPLGVYVTCSLAATVGLVFLVPELVAVAVGVPVGTAIVASIRSV